MAPRTIRAPIAPTSDIFDDDDGWQDMPIIRTEDPKLALDEEDQKRYKYVPPEKLSASGSNGHSQTNATGHLIDFDNQGYEWRAKAESNEDDYTRLKLNDDDEADDAYLQTRYLFDEDKAMTPLSQMQATKNLLTEAQRIAYVGVCYLVARQMSTSLQGVRRKELATAVKGLDLWRLKIMGRVFYHMELETEEQKMIESLGEHGVDPMDLVPALMTTHTVANPEYDPAEARQKKFQDDEARSRHDILHGDDDQATVVDDGGQELPVYSTHDPSIPPSTPHTASILKPGNSVEDQTTANVLHPSSAASIPGVSTTLSTTDENVTLDIRWTVLCDLFLILIADSVYDARSRVLLENVAAKLGLGWLDVVKFEKRVTDALEIQEGAEKLENQEVIDGRSKSAKNRRYVMMGLATLGGGLVIGLSAGLLAPVIGVGLGAAFTTIGVTGTAGFLGGVGGAAAITTGGVLTGSVIAGKGMSRRTRQVRTFDLMPLHNNKRVNCILTVSGWMAGAQDDVRLPFSVLDPIVGDVFSVRWEPEMMGEMGSAFKILTGEVLSQVSTTVLQATVMTALMSALQWPIILTKLGYLIDNPWSNALDRACAAGLVLADVLLNRSLGVRPISIIGFSLGARVIFYALLELAKQKALGIVQDVFLLGATVTAPPKAWLAARGVVAGRFVNGFARNDWVLNYLFRATSGGLNTVAGLRPVENIPGLENVDVTDKIAGHMSYRAYMPVILDQLGFPVSATYFDELEEPDMEGDRIVISREEEEQMARKKSRFSIFSRKPKDGSSAGASSTTPSKDIGSQQKTSMTSVPEDDDLPERIEHARTLPAKSTGPNSPRASTPSTPAADDLAESAIPAKAGFDFRAIGAALGKDNLDPEKIPMPAVASPQPRTMSTPGTELERSESAPPPLPRTPSPNISTPRARSTRLPEFADDYGEGSSPSSSSTSIPALRQSFGRSLSSADVHAPAQSQFAYPSITPPDDDTPPYTFNPYSIRSVSSPSTSSLSAPTWPPQSSTLSVNAGGSSAWAPAQPIRSGFHPINLPPDEPNGGISFGAVDGSISTAANPHLSFGGYDGSITALGSGAEPDPWAPKPISFGFTGSGAKKKAPSSQTSSNPWES